ncbi:beta-lactamase/transpeptidase-like protein [Mycena floridula]|nr:beta-lactamase/transpeptidase-like protein [Mycena floridula]
MLWISALVALTLGAQAEQIAFASPEKTILNTKIDKFVQDVLAEWNSPAGISVAVVKKADDGTWLTETKGYGVAQRDGSKVTTETLFAIGSNSKLFDVLATGLLISNESLSPRISWDSKIASIIPEWELMDPIATQESTIVDLMSHRTGLPRHDFMYGTEEDIGSVIRRLKHLRPSASFRDIYQYNNLMYIVLSYLPQTLLSIPFEKYVQTNIFDRLGMSSTTYSYQVAKASGNLAEGWGREGVNKTEDVFGKGTPQTIEYWNQGPSEGNFISGPGGILMNGNDAAIWLKTLLMEGKNPSSNETVIPAEVVRKVAAGVVVAAGAPTFSEISVAVYGGGQSQASYRGHNLIEHGGGTPGFLTQVTRFPFDNFGIAVFSNDGDFGTMLIEIIKFRILDEVFGLDPVDWNQRFKNRVQAGYDQHKSQITPPPSKPGPPFVPLASLAGLYSNPGYKNALELCLISSPESETCKTLVSDAPVLLPGIVDSDKDTFLIQYPNVFLGYVILQHFDGNLFNISVAASHPTGDKSHPYWATSVTDISFTAEFAEEDGKIGIAFMGNIWGAGEGASSPSGETVKEKAEIWFEKA